ncbi:UNVERIFIED_CONTAM: protein TPLATE [Sesamum radiatum]|uniref:Protein TPLATE n=1 Tax=Sesamum radiatum TaxID=300843 RepID=A0AAW2RB91_SESRA
MSSKSGSAGTASDSGNAERFVGVSDVVSNLAPFLASSLDPALIFEVGINMLYLADVPGGKPEWASTSIIAILTLWDRQEYSSARESIVRAVVTNLHLLDLSMQVLNLTEIELNRVDIRVGLYGGLYFMDGSPQAVRQLRDLNSQEPVLCSVTVGVSHFERCALWVQVLYYPFYGSGVQADYEGTNPEEDPQIIRQKKGSKHEIGKPVILRCQPYKIPLTELLLPHKISPVEYFRLWPSLPAVVECTGTYTYEGSGFKATAAQQYGESPFLSGLKSLSSKPFHKVCSHIIRTVAGFQLCYAAKTWYGGFVGMMIFGASEVSRNVDLGDETTTMICKFVVRASDASITKEIDSDLQGWMDDLTDGTIEYMPEDEVKAAAAERLRTSMERIALLKAARPRPKTPKSDDEEEEEEQDEDEQDTENKENEEGDGKTKGPSTLFKLTAEEVEHRALQVAVLQEWHMLCKDRSTKVN